MEYKNAEGKGREEEGRERKKLEQTAKSDRLKQ